MLLEPRRTDGPTDRQTDTFMSVIKVYFSFQEAAYIKIHAEIPEVLANHAQPVNTNIYPTWEKFLEAFLAKGMIILIINTVSSESQSTNLIDVQKTYGAY